jgi:hypothetical protein
MPMTMPVSLTAELAGCGTWHGSNVEQFAQLNGTVYLLISCQAD